VDHESLRQAPPPSGCANTHRCELRGICNVDHCKPAFLIGAEPVPAGSTCLWGDPRLLLDELVEVGPAKQNAAGRWADLRDERTDLLDERRFRDPQVRRGLTLGEERRFGVVRCGRHAVGLLHMGTEANSAESPSGGARNRTNGPKRGDLSDYASRLVGPVGRGGLDAILGTMYLERDFFASTPDPGREYGYGQRQLELLIQRLSLPDHGFTPVAREKALDVLRRLLPLPVEERKRLSVVLRKILPQRYLDDAFGQAKHEYRESLARAERISEALAGDPRRKLSKLRSQMKRDRRLGTEPARPSTYSPSTPASLRLWASAGGSGVAPSGYEVLP
jgi:hypothetical protein